jgi:hypothetical protein
MVMSGPLVIGGATKGSGIRNVVSAYEMALVKATQAPTATTHARLLLACIAVFSGSDPSADSDRPTPSARRVGFNAIPKAPPAMREARTSDAMASACICN